MRNLYQAYKAEMREELFIKLSPYLLAIALVIVFSLALITAVKRNEKVECLRWQNYEKIYRDFHPSEQMNEQCNQYGIEFEP